MSRHRNVRSLNYSDEYDGYDDVYGHSLEDDYSVSPGSAAFMYDRTRPTQVSTFVNPVEDIAEEESDLDQEEGLSGGRRQLSDLEEGKLRSCLDEARNVLGDSVPDDTLVEAILQYDFDLPRALDRLLNIQPPSKKHNTEVSKPQRPLFQHCSTPDKKDDGNVPAVTVSLPPSKPVLGFDVPINKPVQGKAGSLTPGNQSPKLDRKSPDPDRKKIEEAKSLNANSRKGFKVEEEYRKDRCADGKTSLHMVVVGHVDAGKSTLMGRLLLDVGAVSSKLLHKYQQESKKIGKQSFVYAWILDETGEERSRGITMDVGQNRLETQSKVVTVLDAPGHRDFIPNMITGASQADVALLVVDSTRGEFETGFESGGQTREHALLVRSLGVSQVGVVVNKLDTVGWSEERFKEICHKLSAFLKQAGFKERDVTFIPCSGLSGINLTKEPPDDCPLRGWYKGPTLLQVIDKFESPERPISKPLRVTVNDVFKGSGSGFCISGRIETGFIHQSDRVLILPHSEVATVKGLSVDEDSKSICYAGDYVTATLSGCDQQSVSIGSVLCEPSSPVPVTSSFQARIVVFNISQPITRGFPVVLHSQFLCEQAVITKLISQLSKSSGEVTKRNPRCLLNNSSAIVQVETSRPVCVELYRDVKELGRFMLRVSGVTIAAGLITAISP